MNERSSDQLAFKFTHMMDVLDNILRDTGDQDVYKYLLAMVLPDHHNARGCRTPRLNPVDTVARRER